MNISYYDDQYFTTNNQTHVIVYLFNNTVEPVYCTTDVPIIIYVELAIACVNIFVTLYWIKYLPAQQEAVCDLSIQILDSGWTIIVFY